MALAHCRVPAARRILPRMNKAMTILLGAAVCISGCGVVAALCLTFSGFWTHH